MGRSKILLLIPLLASVGAVLFYCYSFKVELTQIKYEQYAIIKSLSSELDKFVIVSSNLSKFIEKDVNDKKISRREIELKLIQYLNSAPQDVIYGIGLWYEPYILNKEQKFNGIYIHQDLQKNRKFKVTYEWNTPEYNYPSQEWYKLGFNAIESIFTEPYYDSGIVYTTNARTFYFQRKKAGVISVDIVVPLLQNLIIQHSTNSNDYTYILDKNDKTLAHFEKNRIETHDEFKQKKAASLLEVKITEVNKWLKINPSHYIYSTSSHEKLGWKINAQTSIVVGFYRTSELFTFLVISISIIWLSYFYFRNLLKKIDMESELAQEEREKSKMQLLQASKMASLGEMASGVAHEINSPLMVILGKSKHLHRVLDAEKIRVNEAKEQLEIINKTVYRIANIISGLKTFSRTADNDVMTLESMKKILDDSLAIVNEKMKHSNIKIVLEVPDEEVNVKCRPGQITQVTLNLLSNSHDAICELDIDNQWIRLKLEFNDEKDKVFLSVVDSGIGIKSHDVDKIMNPFYTTKEIGKGTGLGLSISKGIIEDHGGEFYYDQFAKNTTFVIVLKCEKVSKN